MKKSVGELMEGINLNYKSSEKLFKIDCGDIYLQEFSIHDVNSIYKISNQSEIVKFLPDWKSTKEQRLDWVSNYEIPANKAFLGAVEKQLNLDKHILKLGIFIKENHKFIGWCCTGIKEELPLPNREIMYAVSSEYQKKGYATKASKGLINYLFTNTNVDVINAVALLHNVSSNKVIQKCGFTYLCQTKIEDDLYCHYVLNKSEWLDS
ncbi:GNAT family N-acetyltransferase [Bacillus spongiae]|uniref:GNAT family N-acetyltransferase n=1 Tax=Bacillus spongiae TaxID=2683610 RepID=A0ABU8HE46_9BACI